MRGSRRPSPIAGLLLVAFVAPIASQAPPSPAQAMVLPLPLASGDSAIWGATGQDQRGHLWFGISVDGPRPHSARLVEYIPGTGQFIDRGNVVAELGRAGLLRAGEQQAKIHSKIVQVGNFLYFASMDEDGEDPSGSRLPTWGGHLWRMNITTGRWQHLLRVPEALIAVGAGGRYVYALGYFGHVLYQYDTMTARTARVEVGSVDGHISRNLLVDDRGHVYVPRLAVEPATGTSRTIRVSLVEYGSDMQERQSTPIETSHYLGSSSPTDAHGIIGLQTMTDRSILLTTHVGRLLRIVPPVLRDPGPATATDAGWIHPRGPSYAPSLFTVNGQTRASTVARAAADPRPWEWVTCDLTPLACEARPLTVANASPADVNRMLLYGSATRDARGGHYVVGMLPRSGPVIIRVQ